MKQPERINGGFFEDHRGRLLFNNSFDLSEIKRMYLIEHPDETVIRAWQGHKKEQKWFMAVSGRFEVSYVEIDDWASPSKALRVTDQILDSTAPDVLHVPGGFATGIRALAPNSKLMVFSDMPVSGSEQDSYRFEVHQWKY